MPSTHFISFLPNAMTRLFFNARLVWIVATVSNNWMSQRRHVQSCLHSKQVKLLQGMHGSTNIVTYRWINICITSHFTHKDIYMHVIFTYAYNTYTYLYTVISCDTNMYFLSQGANLVLPPVFNLHLAEKCLH